MRNFFQASLKTKLALSFAVMLLVPSLLIGILSYQTSKTQVEEEIINNASNTIHFLSNTIDILVTPKIHQVTLFSENLHASEDQSDELAAIQNRLGEYQQLHTDISMAFVGTAAGQFIMSPVHKMPEGYDPRKREWYQEAIKSNENIVITDPYADASTGKIVVSIVKALADGSGVVGVDMSLEKLLEVAGSYKIGQQGFVYILDQSGKIIVHPSLPAGEQVSGDYYDPLFQKEQGQFDFEEGGQKKRTLFGTNKITSWKLAGTAMYAEIEQEVQPIFFTTFLVVSISVLIGSIAISLIIRSLMKPIRTLMGATEKISRGDLRERVKIEAKDEMGQLGVRFNQMVDALAALITGVRQTVEQLAASSEQLTASSQQTSLAAEHIASSVLEVAASTEEQVRSVGESEHSINQFAVGVEQISSRAHQVATGAVTSLDLAEKGSQSLEMAVGQMNQIHATITQVATVIKGLGERSQEIGQIVDDITSIASQTNLLALNAAIEAARAGENGRGFAVVANEVRVLAEQSSLSASRITHMISAIQTEATEAVQSIALGTNEVVTGMTVVNLAGESFQTIKSSVQDVTAQIQEVSASSHQMASSTKNLLLASKMIKEMSMEAAAGAENISSASEEQLASMEEIAASAISLSSMAEELKDMISKFHL